MPEVAVVEEENQEEPIAPPNNASKETPIGRKFREEYEENLLDYLRSLASETPIRVTVIREMPRVWRGQNIEGTLDSYEDPISEDEIRELWGGGKYKLVIYTPSAKGSWQYATARKVKIAGDPKVSGLINTSNNNEETPSVVRDAMRMSQAMIDRAQQRADRAEESSMRRPEGPDAATRLLMQEFAEVRREMAAKDERIFQLMSTKPSNSSADMLLGKMVDGESARMQSLRQQVESELRMKNDMHRAEVDRLHARYEDGAKRQEDQHKREIDNLIRAHDNQMTVMKSSYDGQVAGYTREIAHLDRQLTAAQKEVAELRAKKDKSPVETLTELAAMKEAMESFSGKSDDEGGSTVERIIGSVMGSPLLEGIATRVAGGAPAQNPAQEPETETSEEPELPLNRPVQLPDGRIIMRKADGSIVQIRKKEAPPAPTGGAVKVSDKEIEVAVQFMENALLSDTDPVAFARTARNLLPSLASGPLGQLLKVQGVDAFLERVAVLKPGSTLLQQHGKNWTRKVAVAVIES